MEMPAGSKSVVLGANGYLGRHLIHYLKEACGETHGLDAGPSSQNVADAYSQVDVADPQSLLAVDWNVDCVYAFAGLTGTYAGFDQFDKFVAVNELGLLNVLTAIRKSQHRPRVVFPSTRLVYEGGPSALAEDAPKKPLTIYAINKLACESILDVYANAFAMPYTVFRICVPYGNVVGSGYSYGLTGAFMKQAKERKVVTLYGNGQVRRTLTHVEDICGIIMKGALDERAVNRTFNIPGEAFSLNEIAEFIVGRYGARIEFVEWPQDDLKIESGDTVFDAGKCQALYGNQMRHRFQDWIAVAPPL